MHAERQPDTLRLPSLVLTAFKAFSATCHISMSRLCYEHGVRPSARLPVCLSVTLVDCDHTVQQ